MTRVAAAAVLSTALLISAPAVALADPEDWVPYCSGDQTPMDDNCQQMAHQVFTHGAPGVDPQVPIGLDPGNAAAVG
ncbi:hypothetical protein [Mycolicibacterium thermoresistibile]